MSSASIKFLILALFAAGFLWLAAPGFAVVDEIFHLDQISRLANGDPSHLSNITTFIYLHHIYAWLGQWLPVSEPLDYRLISAALSVLLLLVMVLMVRSTNTEFDWKLAGQLVFLPVIFPYLPLVYTDIPALVCLLLCAWLMHQRQFITAALAGALATWVRQPSLIWLGLLTVWAGLREYHQHQNLMRSALVMLPAAVVMALFAVYFWLNGSVALGEKASHRVSVNPTNAYFMLMMAGVLFLPVVIREATHSWRWLISHRWLWLVLIAGMPVFLLTYAVDSPFNGPQYNMFIRNLILNTLKEQQLLLVLSYLFMAFSALTLIRSPLRNKHFRLLWLAMPLAVMFMPLIEQRYYMMGFALWLLCRQRQSDVFEGLLLLWLMSLSAIIYWGVGHGWFYY